MNAILLTIGTTRQRRAARRKAFASVLPPPTRAAMTDADACAGARARARLPQDGGGGGYLRRAAAGAGVETALFVSVQAVMIACVVLVAAQLLATA